MRILWIVNCPLPEASLLMNEISTPFGGWLVSTSKYLSENGDIELSIAFPKKNIKEIKILNGKKIKYYIFPPINQKDINNRIKIDGFIKILEGTRPDIIHIFGTEYPHTLVMVRICNNKNIITVISIQGLVSICSKHFMAYLPQKIQNRWTIRDFIKQDNLKKQQTNFYNRGKLEIEAIKETKFIIGRTTWDKACTTQINPQMRYYFCNETLRDEFYKHIWEINTCEKNSIFVSQGGYPLKGLHLVLEAMPLILAQYPSTILYVGGHDVTKLSNLKEKFKISSYGRYINELIQKNNLQNKVVFIGILDEKQMCERYLKSNVFVCPSSIENSPNSLGEAMLLGLPCVASNVGGISDLLRHEKDGYVYQADAPYMLAYYICTIFENEKLTLELSHNARNHALETHDKKINHETLMNIYKSIIKN